MRKVQICVIFIVYLLTTMVNYGQTKQGEKPNIKDIFKFDPTEQALKDLKEKDTTGIDISIIDYEPINHYRCEKELNLLLSKYNLNVDSVFYYGTVSEKEDEEYINKKNNKQKAHIAQKFGKNFIDSLLYIAEKQYVQNNIDKVFNFNECDTVSRYAESKYYQNFFDDYKRDFWTGVKYPREFKFRTEKDLYSYMSAEFIVHKDGKVSHIKTDVMFQNKQNNKYATYFREKLIKFIQKSKWMPAKSVGITVTSKVPLTIHFK